MLSRCDPDGRDLPAAEEERPLRVVEPRVTGMLCGTSGQVCKYKNRQWCWLVWFGSGSLCPSLSLSSSSLSFAKFGSPSGGRDRESASLYTRAPEATAMMPSGYALFTNNRSHQLKPTFVKACACCACDKFGPRLRALDCWTRAVALGSLASAGEPKSSVPHIRGRTSNRTRKSRPPFGRMRGSHESTTFAVQCRHKA